MAGDHAHEFKVVKTSWFAATSKGVLSNRVESQCICGEESANIVVTPYGKKEYSEGRWLL